MVIRRMLTGDPGDLTQLAEAGDTVAAIELGLVGDRGERQLAEIRAINSENQPLDL